ncbi:YihY/virulence factor BrkB family protein [Microbacterium sp. ARD32]|uniref:YihY/virulence factor BrkB family protein n=1 Tax=Microbacterium sp. ARD32 TaxID=2962577 RepID=UPI00288189FA|nr:YihY/virulence factor BrkB family protein [Microbacterium sp. ARD32]MDT0157323.1 YihY/virulence factor BrkB family protein [Microbacterium sp. ARD32]
MPRHEHPPATGRDGAHRAQWRLVIGRVARGFFRTSSADAAAGLTFYAVLAGFPAIVAAFSLIGLTGRKQDVISAILDAGEEVLDASIIADIREPVEDAAASAGGGWVLTISLVVALWSVARYVTALGRAINRAYDVPEGRVVWKAKPVQLLITLAVFVLVWIAGLLAALSWPVARSLGRALGAGEVTLTVWRLARWPAVVLVVMLVVAILYYFAPNVRHPRFRLVSVGAAIAIVLFALASAGFGFYVGSVANYDRLYGSFAGIVVFLVWLWLGNMALLVGALFDAELERLRELRAGIPAERTLQVQLRGTERLQRNAENDVRDARRARRIRRSRP